MACQSACEADLFSDLPVQDEDACQYIVGIVKDRLAQELDYLMGVTARPGDVPPQASQPAESDFTPQEVQDLRSLASRAHDILVVLSGSARQQAALFSPGPPSTRASPPDEDRDPGFDPPDEPLAPSPSPVRQKPAKSLAGLRQKSVPMPSVSAMAHVTGMQAVEASQMGIGAFERVRRGQASSSGGINESTG